MHQRRTGNRLPDNVAHAQSLLLQRWYTARQLADALGVCPDTAKFCVKAIAQQRYVFARKSTDKWQPRAYRLYPEARGVRSV